MKPRLLTLILILTLVMVGYQVIAKGTNMKIKTGDEAPLFSLPSQSGDVVHLKDFRGKKNVVLYFYPKDDTPGCTKEACLFRDQYEDFTEVGAEVIGVSSDAVTSHQQFSSKFKLPFVLVSDVGGKVRKNYGVASTLGLLPGRVTFVIDKKGVVRHVFSSQFSPLKHVNEALQILKTL